MLIAPIDPLVEMPIDPVVVALPKAELHLHQEASARLERIAALHEGRTPYDWRRQADLLLREQPAGTARLDRMNGDLDLVAADRADADPAMFVVRLEGLLEEAAADGAVLAEVRFGRNTVLRPDFMVAVREAERRVQARHPRLHAEAIICTYPHDGREEILEGCIRAAREGLAGIDFIPTPYDAEADFAPVERWAARAADAGLGITIHAAEFSTANLAAALRVPGVRRIGHATYAATDPRLLEQLARSGVTIECCLSSNVVLGAVASYEEHPIRRFVEHGVPVTLSTDNPVRMCTTIGREYAIAAALGFSPAELLSFTRNAVSASFAPAERRAEMRTALDAAAGLDRHSV